MSEQDELKIRFGEIVGLCYISEVGERKISWLYRDLNRSHKESGILSFLYCLFQQTYKQAYFSVHSLAVASKAALLLRTSSPISGSTAISPLA